METLLYYQHFLRFLLRDVRIPLFGFFFILSGVLAQTTSEKNGEVAYYDWFDKQVQKEHLPLYNGIGYVEQYKVINEYHKFYKSIDFLKGSLFYDGQLYANLELKYDLHEDLVLLNLKNGQRIVLLQPDQEKIENFTIDGKYFIHVYDHILQGNDASGYYELLYEGSHFELLEKHTKKRFERKGKNSLYSEFKSRNKSYIFYEGVLYVLQNRKDFEEIFPEFKKEIQEYSKKRFPKENRRAHLIALSKRINDLINNSKLIP